MAVTDKRSGWLRELHTGDDVIIVSGEDEYIRRVKKIMPSGRIVTIGIMRLNEDVFDPDGKKEGKLGALNHTHLEQATLERIRIVNGNDFSRI